MKQVFQTNLFQRGLIVLTSSLIILTTAQSCNFPFFGQNTTTPPSIGLMKKGDNRTANENFIKINAVRQLDGNIDVDGLNDLSGIKIARYDENILYFLTQSKGLFRSDDGGYIWERKYVYPIGSTAEDQETINNEIRAQIRQNDALESSDIAINPQNQDIIYLAAQENDIGKIFRSVDAGQTFREIYTEVEDNVAVKFISVDPRNPNRVYGVLTGGSLIRSLDGGITWQKIRSFRETPIQIGFVPEFNNLFYLLFPRQGLAFSTDDGETWETQELLKSPSAIGEDQPRDGLDFTFSGRANFGRFERISPVISSTDRGWLLIADRQIWYTPSIDQSLDKIVLPLASERQNLYDAVPDPVVGLERIYISIDDKLFETTNRGQSWKISDRVSGEIGNIGQILIEPTDPNVIYLMLIDRDARRRDGVFV